MPELPEVESIKLTLAEKILGKTIVDVKILWPPAALSLPDRDFSDLVVGSDIEDIGRRGKYLLIHLNNGLTMITHFRMTGRMIYYSQNQSPDKHTHIIFYLENGEMHYSDIRKFGRVQLVSTKYISKVPSLSKLGPEPLDEEFAFDKLGKQLSSKKKCIKASLLDQTVIAGLGNIYVDEALFRSAILPERGTNSLKASEVILLYNSICDVLSEGIEARGTSFRDYRDADGKKGSFQDRLMVYGRGGQECRICEQALERKKIAGRTTVFCSQCQK